MKSSRILVIEDDRFLREIIVGKIRERGYEVIESVTGEDGLEKIKAEKPALVVLDLILPGIDGFEVLERIRKDKKTASISVLILSNFGQKADRERGFRLGVKDYLIKAHINPSEVVNKIEEILTT